MNAVRAAACAVAAGILALAVGCAPVAPTAAAPPGTIGSPTTLTYEQVGVDTDILPTGLTDSGEFAVPPITDPQSVVWLHWHPGLAEDRPLVVAAHVSGRDHANRPIPGAFARLDEAQVGDEVTVRDAAGTATRYVVREVEAVDKDTFPTERVYGPRPGDWLVLVTCGGVLDETAGSYEDNVLVFAEALPAS